MEGEHFLKKASITQQQIGLHCVDYVSLYGDCFESQLYDEASDRALASRNQAATRLSGVG